MKHLRIILPFLVLAFVSLNSFESNTAIKKGCTTEEFFEYAGGELDDPKNPNNWVPSEGENMACNGQQGHLCQIRVKRDPLTGLPDATELSALLDEANVSPGIYQAGTYVHGKVKVYPD
jgi:hypothetical protein